MNGRKAPPTRQVVASGESGERMGIVAGHGSTVDPSRDAALALGAVGAGTALVASSFRRALPTQLALSAAAGGVGWVAGNAMYDAAGLVTSGRGPDGPDAGLALVLGGGTALGVGRLLRGSGRLGSVGHLASAIGGATAIAGAGALAVGSARHSMPTGPAGLDGGVLAGIGAAAAAVGAVALAGGLRRPPSVTSAATHVLDAGAVVARESKDAIKSAHVERVAQNLGAYESMFGPAAVDGLGGAGRRLVVGRALPSEIRAVHPDGPIADPVRIFVGRREGHTADDRARIAMERLSGNLDDVDDVLVLVPNAMGDFLPQVPFAQELMSRGRTATIVVQSVAKRPWSAMGDIPKVGAEQLRVVGAVHEAMAAAGRAPGTYRVLVDGHCYGALTGGAIASNGVDGMRATGVDAALLTAGPLGWGPQRRAIRETLASGDGVVLAQDVASLDALHAAGASPAIVWGQKANDPMRIRLGDLWRPMTDAAGTPLPGPNVPVVRAMAEAFDLAAYGTRPAGKLFDAGHDFRAMSPRAVRAAYAHHGIDDSQMRAIDDLVALAEARKVRSGSRSRL